LLLALAGAAAGGCRAEEPAGIDRDTFVATYVDLRLAALAGALDSLARDSILRSHDVTEADLRAYLESRADDPAALSKTWREVMDRMAPPDTVLESDDSVRPNR